MSTSTSYHEYVIKNLREHPEEQVDYLNTAFEDDDPRVFLLALHHVVKARGSITELADELAVSRPSLYKSLSEDGNPYLSTITDILTVLGLRLQVVPVK